MSIPNLIPHKALYISGYICSCYAFVFISDFPEHISKHILQFHSSFFSQRKFGLALLEGFNVGKPTGTCIKIFIAGQAA